MTQQGRRLREALKRINATRDGNPTARVRTEFKRGEARDAVAHTDSLTDSQISDLKVFLGEGAVRISNHPDMSFPFAVIRY